MIAIIGGIALRQHINVERNSLDIDIVGTYDQCMDFAKTYFSRITECYPIKQGNKLVIKGFDHSNIRAIMECEIAWEGSHTQRFHNMLISDQDSNKQLMYGKFVIIPSLDVLYMIKMSHRFLKNTKHFLKTMSDIKLMERNGAQILDRHIDIYNERTEYTYDYKHPNLNVGKDDFFNKSESFYVYDHDSIHLAVMHLDQPAYMFFKPKDKQVMCDRQMFEDSPLSIQLLAGLEEAYVLALERSVIPFGDKDRKKSFDLALEKVCTSITSGYFREFCYNNYHSIQALYNDNYVDRFYEAVNNGNVPLFQQAA